MDAMHAHMHNPLREYRSIATLYLLPHSSPPLISQCTLAPAFRKFKIQITLFYSRLCAIKVNWVYFTNWMHEWVVRKEAEILSQHHFHITSSEITCATWMFQIRWMVKEKMLPFSKVLQNENALLLLLYIWFWRWCVCVCAAFFPLHFAFASFSIFCFTFLLASS